MIWLWNLSAPSIFWFGLPQIPGNTQLHLLPKWFDASQTWRSRSHDSPWMPLVSIKWFFLPALWYCTWHMTIDLLWACTTNNQPHFPAIASSLPRLTIRCHSSRSCNRCLIRIALMVSWAKSWCTSKDLNIYPFQRNGRVVSATWADWPLQFMTVFVDRV